MVISNKSDYMFNLDRINYVLKYDIQNYISSNSSIFIYIRL